MTARFAVRPAAACLAALFAFALTPLATAGEGEAITLPTFGGPKNGLLLTVNTIWVESPGYRPVFVEVRTANGLPSKEERRLTVQITPSSNWGFERHIHGEIVLPQGEIFATGHVLVPQSNEWHSIHIATSENGRTLKDLSQNYVQVNRNNSGFDLSRPKMLVIDTDAPTLADRAARRQTNQALRNAGNPLPAGTYDLPDIRGLLRWNPSNNYPSVNQAVDDATLIDVVYGSSNLEIMPPEQLPEKWIAFSSLDLIFVSLADMIAIRTGQPRLAAALKEWAGSGGNLVVFGLGHNYQRLNQLEAVLGVEGRTRGSPLGRWQPGATASDRQISQLQTLASTEWSSISQHLANHPNAELKKTQEELNDLQREWRAVTVNNPDWFPMRVLPFGHGKVIAMPEDDPFPGSQMKWEWLEKTTKPYSTWNSRVGVDLQNGDHQFLSYMIPGVGLPPVKTFCLLITLFVIVIGPVNYLLLKRRKRLFLLLVTVPVGAGIVTLSLFSYAIIKDGLSVQARVHSFTQLDQRAGLASSWSRQTYFASLPPSQGLVYPESATVHPIFDNDWQTRRAQESTSRTLNWEGGVQRLRRGYLGSRTTTEFLVANSEPLAEINLIFERQGAGKPPRVINQLGVNIDKLLLVAGDGNTYWVKNMEPDQAARPEPRERSAAMEIFQTAARENQPVDPGLTDRGNFLLGYRRYRPKPNVTGQGILGHGRYRTISAAPDSDEALEPGEFLAIVDRCPFVPLGVEVSEEEASFHVIRGRYVEK